MTHPPLQPDVNVVELGDCDRWIVLGTDGVWEVMSSQEVIETCACKGEPGAATDAIGEIAWRRGACVTSS